MSKTVCSVMLVLGLVLWGPGVDGAAAQMEVDPVEIQAALATDPEIQADPELHAICLEQVEEIAADPEGPEARSVELAAVAIDQVTETTRRAVSNSQTIAREAQDRLVASGVPEQEASRMAGEMSRALERVRTQLEQGKTVADLDLSQMRSALEAMGGLFEGGSAREMLAGAPGEGGQGDRPDFQIAMALMESDPVAGAMREHFQGSYREMITQGAEGGFSPDRMREMMETAMAAGMNPREFMAGPAEGTFEQPPAEVLEQMSPEQRVAFEAFRGGDFERLADFQRADALAAGEMALREGMPQEVVARELVQQEFFREMESQWREATDPAVREAIEVYAQEALDNQNYDLNQEISNNTIEKEADGHAKCPVGTVHQEGVAEGPGHCL